MKTHVFVLLALFCSFNLQAYSNFIENPYTPYPPGCATLPDLQTALNGNNAVKFFEQDRPLFVPGTPLETAYAIVTAYRVACSDANRSVILLEFTVPENGTTRFYQTPDVRATIGDGLYGLSLVREPNGWDAGIEPWNYSQDFGGGYDFWGVYDTSWIFVLDSTTSFYPYFEANSAISPALYNGSFTLEFNRNTVAAWDIQVPSTASLFASTPRIPLSGRLSGNWVVDGASDQGFVIAVSEVVPDSVPEPNELRESPLLMFLSWYTYDADGEMLWLTGATQFEMGSTEVTIPIEKVTHGAFMGDKTADRSVVGSVTITGNNCNDLTLQYDLGDIGLGVGTEHLQRLFSLETAGYVCRDLEARMATK